MLRVSVDPAAGEGLVPVSRPEPELHPPQEKDWLTQPQNVELFMRWEEFQAQIVRDKMIHVVTDDGARSNPVQNDGVRSSGKTSGPPGSLDTTITRQTIRWNFVRLLRLCGSSQKQCMCRFGADSGPWRGAAILAPR
jgi:hypothetical protein